VGFRSGCCDGRDWVLIWWSSVGMAVWIGALSCGIKTMLRAGEYYQSISIFRDKGKSYGFAMT